MNVCIVGTETKVGGLLFELLHQDNIDITVLVRTEQEKQALQNKGARVISASPEENGPWIEALPQKLDYIINCTQSVPSGRLSLNTLENTVAPKNLHIGQNLTYIGQRKQIKRIFQMCTGLLYKSLGDAELGERSTFDASPANYGVAQASLIAYLQSQKNVPVTFCVHGHYIYDGSGWTYPEIPALFSSAYTVAGSGENMVQLSHAEDIAGAIRQCLIKDYAEPVINMVDNKAITQGDFMRILAQVNKKTPVIPLPQQLISLLFGDAYAQSITSTRILKNETLKNLGYWLKYPDYTSGFSTQLFNRI